MKTLEEFNLIREFLIFQGIKPTVAMVGLEATAWADIVLIAMEWKRDQDVAEEVRKAELDGLSEEELAQRERDVAEEAKRAEDAVLFHSCGHRPERR